MSKNQLVQISLASVLTILSTSPSQAIDTADDAGVFGSITLAKQAREAVKAIKAGNYAEAANAYKSAIAMNHGIKEFYYGLLYAGQKIQAWDQVSLALEGIAEQDPAAKAHLAYEFGNCYTKTGRYQEAIPYLKAALKNADKDNTFVADKVKELIAMTAKPAPPVVKTPEQLKREREIAEELKRLNAPPPPLEKADENEVNIYKSKAGDNYLNAWLASEWIGVCEYRGYQAPKNQKILFHNPPTANFYWTEWIKGPPLNHHLPVKFKFYEYDGAPMPAGWTFGPDKMPKIGSKWIIFIPNAVPVEGGFDTYKGSFGRQEATDENLGKILAEKESHHGQQ
ncbi:MAG: hypothetical protein JSS83_26110 [Cyanobacteria bacterium SZAS LIN-3]|nr:hypothetical protein [Cyanobacteria bacterium SZAS LIN-3]